MNKPMRLLAIFVVVGLLLASCGPAPTAAPEIVKQTVVKEVEKVVTAVPPEPKIKGTIRVGSWESGGALEPWNNAIKGFEAKYPGVKVNLEAVPDAYGDKLLTQFAAGTAPDVFMVGDGDVAKFVGKGAVQDLDPYITGDNPLDLNVFYPGPFSIGQLQGKTYLMTKDYSPLVIFYNKTLFDEAKVPYPAENWTWDDFLATAQALTKTDASGNITQWGIQLPDSWGDAVWFRGMSPLIYQNGGKIIGDDGKKASGFMNSPETVEAVQFYVDLFNKHKVAPNKTDLTALQGVDLFQTGKVAMLWNGRWPIKDFQKNTALNFSTAGLPMKKQHGNSICWAGFAMYAKGQNKDTAWAFLKYIAAEEGAQQFAKYALTAVKPVAELQGLDQDPYNAAIIKDLAYVVPLPELTNPAFGECAETPFKAALEKLLLQGGEVQAALDEAAAKADACLAKQ